MGTFTAQCRLVGIHEYTVRNWLRRFRANVCNIKPIQKTRYIVAYSTKRQQPYVTNTENN